MLATCCWTHQTHKTGLTFFKKSIEDSRTPDMGAQKEKVPKVPNGDPQLKKTAFNLMIEEGATLPGDLAAVDNPQDIEWFDADLFEKGRQFVQNNYVVIQAAIIAANCIGFSAKQIAAVFFRNFYPENSCGIRFLSTFHSEAAWMFSSNPTDLSSSFIKEITRVKKLHKCFGVPKIKPIIPPKELEMSYPPEYTELLETIRADLKDVDTSSFPAHLITWTPAMYFTQFDVALVQFGPLAPLLLCPDMVGLYTKFEDDEGLRGYFHIWAVVGRMLGLEDRFNLALHAPDRDLYWEFVKKIGLPSLKLADESVIFATSTLVKELSKIFPLVVTVKSIIYMTLRADGNGGENLWASMGLRDKLSICLTDVAIFTFRFRLVRVIASKLLRWMQEMHYKIYLSKHW